MLKPCFWGEQEGVNNRYRQNTMYTCVEISKNKYIYIYIKKTVQLVSYQSEKLFGVLSRI